MRTKEKAGLFTAWPDSLCNPSQRVDIAFEEIGSFRRLFMTEFLILEDAVRIDAASSVVDGRRKVTAFQQVDDLINVKIIDINKYLCNIQHDSCLRVSNF